MYTVSVSVDPSVGPLSQLTRYLLGVRTSGYVRMANLRHLSQPPHPPPHPPPPNHLSWSTRASPICTPILAAYLCHHPDREFVSFILHGLVQGFHVGYNVMSSGARLRSGCRNHPSSLANAQVVRDYIGEEILAGRMVGPLCLAPHRSIHCSPIGLVPKGRGSGQWRMIVDLSYPEGHSVNDGILPSLCTVDYSSVDRALQFITRLGRDTLLLKIDLKSAYRIVPLHPQDQHLFGVTWDNWVYVDQALPFGLRSAPVIFTAVADAIGWALLEAGLHFHIHYLDDFLFFIPPATVHVPTLPLILHTLSRLGVPVATHKIEGPATIVTFLGIVVDTSRFELRLPGNKLDHMRSLVRPWRTRRSGRHKDFESLLGHLSHAATVIRQGRIFLRHLFSILKAPCPSGFVHLDVAARADLLWWEYFLVHWNGTMFFQHTPVASIHVYTDASGSFGCGGLVPPSMWFQLQWPQSWASINIAVKELVPVVISAALWGGQWHRSTVCFHSDNMAVVSILQSGSTSDVNALHLLRCFHFYSALFQFDYLAEHIPGVQNNAADALSRDNLHLFPSLFSQETQYSVPSQLSDLLVSQRPDWGSLSWTALFVDTLGMH